MSRQTDHATRATERAVAAETETEKGFPRRRAWLRVERRREWDREALMELRAGVRMDIAEGVTV